MAPAGSYEALQAAVQAGADAVYFGVGQLNMRSKSAANFTPDDLERIVGVARAAGVKSYLTVNTVIYEDELRQMHALVDLARAAGVDAVIASCRRSSTRAASGWRCISPRSATSRTVRR